MSKIRKFKNKKQLNFNVEEEILIKLKEKVEISKIDNPEMNMNSLLNKLVVDYVS